MSDDPHRLGPTLSFAEHDPRESPTGPWQPLSVRISEAKLRTRVQLIQDTFGARSGASVDRRVAASTEHLGLVARLVAAHVCGRAVGAPIDLTTATIWCAEAPGAMTRLSCVRAREERDPLQSGVIREFTDRIQQLYAVSPHVLWGNIGSAANSTLTLLRTARPDLVEAATRAADELLRDPRVDGGTLHAGPGFRRRSCCLVYRAIDGICGDCVLRE